MRKTLLVMVALLFAAPVFAGTVTMSITDEGDGWVAIRYSADANVSGFGLKISAGSGAVITDINDYNVGECTATVKGFGIFPGTIDINATTGLVDGNGTPVAPNDAPGAAGTGIDTNAIVVEMGALYVEGNEPGLSGTLIKIQVDKDCNVCVEGEPTRGNVVLTDANEAITNLPLCAAVVKGYDCGDCPLDISGWEGPGITDGFVGPEDVLYMTILTNGCPYQYCDVTGLTDAEACLDVSGWEGPGIPDGFVGPEDVLYITILTNGCPYQYCTCPIE